MLSFSWIPCVVGDIKRTSYFYCNQQAWAASKFPCFNPIQIFILTSCCFFGGRPYSVDVKFAREGFLTWLIQAMWVILFFFQTLRSNCEVTESVCCQRNRRPRTMPRDTIILFNARSSNGGVYLLGMGGFWSKTDPWLRRISWSWAHFYMILMNFSPNNPFLRL